MYIVYRVYSYQFWCVAGDVYPGIVANVVVF